MPENFRISEGLSFIRKTKNGTLLDLHVQPRASKDRVSGLYGSRLKIHVQAPPADGKANKACQKLLSKVLKIPGSRLILKSGASSRQKTFLVKDTEPEYVAYRLKP